MWSPHANVILNSTPKYVNASPHSQGLHHKKLYVIVLRKISHTDGHAHDGHGNTFLGLKVMSQVSCHSSKLCRSAWRHSGGTPFQLILTFSQKYIFTL